MIADFTREQLAALSIHGRMPLVICDVDEVVVHFTRDFERFIGEEQLYLDAASFALHGNIRRRDSHEPAADHVVSGLIDAFFRERTEHLEPIDGAVDALLDLSREATVVMLTNLPHSAREQRVRNLRRLGLPFPCITNAGPKGPAINHLASQTAAPVVFIDDSPSFISSCRDHAGHVHMVHFLHDERFARHHPPFDFVSLTTGSWQEAHPYIEGLLA